MAPARLRTEGCIMGCGVVSCDHLTSIFTCNFPTGSRSTLNEQSFINKIHLQRRCRTNPKVRLFFLVPGHQIVKTDGAVGNKYVGNGRIMEYCYAQCIGIFHFVYKRLIPRWIESLAFGSGPICKHDKKRIN